MAFQNRIKILRKSKKLSQKEFGALFSVDQTAVSNWEMGKNNIDLSLADRIADYFNLPVEYIYGKPYTLTRPKELWLDEERAAYDKENDAGKALLDFIYGRGVFEGSGATLHALGSPSEEDIKVALFGGDGDVSEELWQEVKNFVAFIKQKKDQ